MNRSGSIPATEKKRRLVESIRLLASDSEVQQSSLPDFVHKPDEIALIFDEARRYLDELVNMGLVTTEQANVVKDIDSALNRMSDQSNRDLWTIESLRSNVQWETIRSMARQTLTAFGCAWSKPNLDWATYVAGH